MRTLFSGKGVIMKKADFRGKIHLGERVDFTDPCYDKDVWCRMTVDGFLPGTYNCYASYNDEGRVAESWIIHEKCDIGPGRGQVMLAESVVLAGCGVDAGLFGYFDDKPDFDDAQWYALCNNLQEINVVNGDFDGRDGFYTESGYGDGVYCPVLWKNKEGRIIGACTNFVD